ncbi:MAG: DUF1013 domain-containing protein [Rhodospirillaceae bacterium]|nr:DUF1013 domain-containing protein [Rhodospirillaceae bacterium]
MIQRQPLMPKATAVWLVENTALTFEQIAAFCGLHELEIAAIADGEVATGMVGLDPIANGQLTKDEIDRCQADPDAHLEFAEQTIPQPAIRTKGPRYTPVTKRADKPDAIAWLLRNHPELTDAAIGRLIGTTKPTIAAVRDRTHWNSPNIKPRHPVMLGLCKQVDLDEALDKAKAARRPMEGDETTGDGEMAPVGDEQAIYEPGTEAEAEDAQPELLDLTADN